MLKQLKSTYRRAEPTLLHDALGASALILLLMLGLFIPALV